jgi:hypothetical protein
LYHLSCLPLINKNKPVKLNIQAGMEQNSRREGEREGGGETERKKERERERENIYIFLA